MRRFISIVFVALLFGTGLYAQDFAAPRGIAVAVQGTTSWTSVDTQLTVVQEGQQLHASVQSATPFNGKILTWDQYLSADLAGHWNAGDTAYVAAAENVAANAVWSQQAQPVTPPSAPVTLGTITATASVAPMTVQTYQTNQQVITGFCSSSLVTQALNTLPQATLLTMLGQIQALIQNALPK